MSKEHNLTFRDLLIVMVSEIETIKKLFYKQEKYKALIHRLSQYNIHERSPLPSQKELLKILDLNRSKLMGLMQDLYDEFRTEISHWYPIKKTEVHISGKQRNGDFFQVAPDDIKHIPSEGDHISVPFIRNEYGNGGYFQVKMVKHTIEENTHSIVVFVNEDFRKEDF
mgnify:FL=1